MRQIIQSFKTGQTILEQVPAPVVAPGMVLIDTTVTLVSAGTERMLVEFGRASLVAKARAQPERVRQVLDKISAEGLMPTLEAVFAKLEQPIPLGYCHVGRVRAVGAGVTHVRPGDRVASNGPHAELVLVPKNLVVPIPDSVNDEEAAFTVIGAIGLQGIRLIAPTLSEVIVVQGLGLIGLLAGQLLKAHGARVIGYDFDGAKVELARRLGFEAHDLSGGLDPVAVTMSATGGRGADGVLIAASAKGDTVLSQAARMSRKRGRIVLVGVVGLGINRAEFYEKELTFQVSCSYGPGRYDEAYEQRGQDYPLPFVRWTEQRNFEAVLDQIARGGLMVDPLITERVPLDDYARVYDHLGQSGSVASLLLYPAATEATATGPGARTATQVTLNPAALEARAGDPGIGLIGAGNFTKMTLLPALKKSGARLVGIASQGGVSGTFLARKFGAGVSTTRYQDLLESPAVDLVMITTRHDKHAPMTLEAIEAGKDVFVEKPLALTHAELDEILAAAARTGRQVTVGFNRRYAPLVQRMARLLGPAPGPISLVATMNAGAIPPSSWVQDLAVGGGRIVGEACHLMDLCAYLAGSPITAVCMQALGPTPTRATDSAMILMRHASGAQSVVNYLADGHKAYAKERVEAYHQGRVLIMDNYRRLDAYGFARGSSAKGTLDKGHAAHVKEMLEARRAGRPLPISLESAANASRAALCALDSLEQGGWVDVI